MTVRIVSEGLYRLSFIFFLIIGIGIAGVYHYSRDLPAIDSADFQSRAPQIRIFDRNGTIITRHGVLHGEPVTTADLPPHVVQAFIATEDRNFFHHMGVNPFAIMRALFVNFQEGEIRQGGSTITQQFAKNAFLTSDRTVDRKIREILLAIQIEMKWSKDEILALYLNNVYFGSGTYGITAASRRYFDKRPGDLTVGEAAMLAGLLKAPSRYSPTSNPDAARARAVVVLNAMVEAGYLSRDQMAAIRLKDVADIRHTTDRAPFASSHAMSEFQELLGEPTEDVDIYTSIDLPAQSAARSQITSLSRADARFTSDIEVAMLALEADGAIRVLIGGRSFRDSQYNRATMAERQPGSVFKPFIYLAALESGKTPHDIVDDSPIVIDDWAPSNYKDVYAGDVTLEEAMARSLNAAAIRLQEETGRSVIQALVRRLGFRGKLDPGAAMALGVNAMTPLDLAQLYLPFANDGYTAEPFIISRVQTPSGKVIFDRPRALAGQAIEPETLVAINHMLRRVVSNGSGVGARLDGYHAAGKTGTTQESRDAWFAGHAAGLVGVVWIGRDDNAPMRDGNWSMSGSGTPATLWKGMMMAALQGRPEPQIVPWEPKPPLPSLIDRVRDILQVEAVEGELMTGGGEAVAQHISPTPVPTAEEAPAAYDSMDRLLAEVLSADQPTRAAADDPLLDVVGEVLATPPPSSVVAQSPAGDATPNP